MGTRSIATLTLLGVFLVGCGAKTGLPHPELRRDAGQPEPPPAPLCIELPEDPTVPVFADLEVEAEVGRADVVFLIDVTGSMVQELERIRRRLRDTIAPAIEEAIPDAELAVATLGDFPVLDYGDPREDRVFELRSIATNDIAQVQAAVDGIRLGAGGDQPEAQVEALYQLATGEGLPPYVTPRLGCPVGGLGYACLRPDALPIVLLFTDAPMHQGPAGFEPYDPGRLGVTPHTYAEARAALRGLGARVIGFGSGDGAARPELAAIARDTNTLDGDGQPLVYDIGTDARSLDTDVVGAIRTFAGSVVQDIDAVLEDPDATDGVDPRDFVSAFVPASAVPMSGIERIDTARNAFVQVQPGTLLTFRIEIRGEAVVPGDAPRSFPLRVVFRGDERNFLDEQLVTLVIPARDGRGCEALDNEG